MKSNCKSTQTIAHQDEGEGLHGNNESNKNVTQAEMDGFMDKFLMYLYDFGLDDKADVIKQVYQKSSEVAKNLKVLIEAFECNETITLIRSKEPVLEELLKNETRSQIPEKSTQLPLIYKCNFCTDEFSSQNQLQKHFHVHNSKRTDSESKYQCGECNKTYSSYQVYWNHKKSLHHKVRYNCDLPDCDKNFPSQKSLDKHIFIVHETKRYTCKECGKNFLSHSALKNHYQEFPHKSKLDEHHGAKWPCDKCNNKVFFNKQSWYKHKKNVHEKKPCHICGKMFYNTRLKDHFISCHTDESLKPHICQTCKKGFVHKHILEKHMKIHTGEKPHECKYCSKGFTDVSNMRMHEKTTHEGYKRKKSSKPVKVVSTEDSLKT